MDDHQLLFTFVYLFLWEKQFLKDIFIIIHYSAVGMVTWEEYQRYMFAYDSRE